MNADQKRMYKLMARIIAAAGHEIRLAILDYLKGGEQCVCDIAKHVGANRPNVSRHLAVMRNAGLVSQRKEGLKMMYALHPPCILSISDCVRNVLKDQARQTKEILASLP
jgi:DNA-binding transcriptional ArsR family regulator